MNEAKTDPGQLRPETEGEGDLTPGSRVASYRIGRRISRGGFGAIYRAENIFLGRPVALKVLHGELTGSREAVLRFVREARAVNLIRHPNIVDVFDFGELADGRPYFVMDLLEGEDLAEHLARRGRLPIVEVARLLAPLCAALAAAHDKGVIHRDVKASNVFLARDGRVVLLDFGVAKLLDAPGGDLTASRQALGTPASMAPEQVLGLPVDPRTDVYALGVLAFTLIAGAPPFADAGVTQVKQRHARDPRPRLSARAVVPAAVERVVLRAMSIDPALRFPSAAAFMDAFRAAAAGVAADPDAPVLVLAVDVVLEAASRDAPDEELLADVEALRSLASATLASAGWNEDRQVGSSLVFVADDVTVERRERAAREAGALAAALASRPGHDPRVGVLVRLGLGPRTQLYAPPRLLTGSGSILADDRFLEGLDLRSQPAGGRLRWLCAERDIV